MTDLATLARPRPTPGPDLAGLTRRIRDLDAELLNLRACGLGAHPRTEDIRRDKRRLSAIAQACAGEPPPHTD